MTESRQRDEFHAIHVVTLDLGEQLSILKAELLEELRVELHSDVWPRYMAIDTASRYVDCSIERLRKLVATRRIPFLQEGPACRIFFDRHDLDHWMHNQRHEAR